MRACFHLELWMVSASVCLNTDHTSLPNQDVVRFVNYSETLERGYKNTLLIKQKGKYCLRRDRVFTSAKSG